MFCLISYFNFFLYFDVRRMENPRSQGKEKDNCLEIKRDAEVNLIFV